MKGDDRERGRGVDLFLPERLVSGTGIRRSPLICAAGKLGDEGGRLSRM